jgi:hypothetical protein
MSSEQSWSNPQPQDPRQGYPGYEAYEGGYESQGQVSGGYDTGAGYQGGGYETGGYGSGGYDAQGYASGGYPAAGYDGGAGYQSGTGYQTQGDAGYQSGYQSYAGYPQDYGQQGQAQDYGQQQGGGYGQYYGGAAQEQGYPEGYGQQQSYESYEQPSPYTAFSPAQPPAGEGEPEPGTPAPGLLPLDDFVHEEPERVEPPVPPVRSARPVYDDDLDEDEPKRRSGKLIGIVVAVAVVAGGAAAYMYVGGSKSNGSTAAGGTVAGTGAASASPSPTHSAKPVVITVPASAGGLKQMTNSVGKSVVATMKKSSASNADLANAEFAAYEKSGSTTFLGDLTLVPLGKAANLQQTYQVDGAAGALKDFGASAFTDTESITLPVPGSAMICGLSTTENATLRMCMWVDQNEFGLFGGVKSLSDAQAATYAKAFESASESPA